MLDPKESGSSFDLSSASKGDAPMPSDDFFINSSSASSSSRGRDVFEEEERKRKKKLAALAGGGLLTTAALVAGLMVFNPFGDGFQGGPSSTPTSTITQEPNSSQVKSQTVENKDAFWMGDNGLAKYPVKKSQAQSLPAGDEGYEGDQLGDVVKAYDNTEIDNKSTMLPSREAGFTSNVKEAVGPDGRLNPRFTFATQEDYERNAISYVERLINPVYGDWTEYQYSYFDPKTQFDTTRFQDMFTKGYFAEKKNTPPKDYFPLFADWNSDDYGMKGQLLENGPRWMGKLDGSTSKFTLNKEGFYDVQITANVTYSAWAKDQSILTKKGVLVLDLVSNHQNPDDEDHKFLIDKASLTIKD